MFGHIMDILEVGIDAPKHRSDGIVKFQYATSAMLALPYDHFLVSLLFLDVPITVIVPSLLLTSFLNVFI